MGMQTDSRISMGLQGHGMCREERRPENSEDRALQISNGGCGDSSPQQITKEQCEHATRHMHYIYIFVHHLSYVLWDGVTALEAAALSLALIVFCSSLEWPSVIKTGSRLDAAVVIAASLTLWILWMYSYSLSSNYKITLS